MVRFGGCEEQKIRLMAEGVEVVGNKVVMGVDRND